MFIIGLIAGVFIGAMMMCLLQGGDIDDDEIDYEFYQNLSDEEADRVAREPHGTE